MLLEGSHMLFCEVAASGVRACLSLVGGSIPFGSSFLLLLQPTGHHLTIVEGFLVNAVGKDLSKTALKSRHLEYKFPRVGLGRRVSDM